MLGPLLLIFVNDLVKTSKPLIFMLYADDSVLFISDFHLPTLISTMTYEIIKVNKLMKCNKLTINKKRSTLQDENISAWAEMGSAFSIKICINIPCTA